MTISNSSPAGPASNPSLTVDATGRVEIGWQAFDHSKYYINPDFERSVTWPGPSLSAINQFVGYYGLDQPSICGHTDANGGATLMMHMQDNANDIWSATSPDGVSWNSSPGSPGRSIASNASYPRPVSTASPSNVPFVLTITNSTPYVIRAGYRNETAGTGGLYKQSAAGGGFRFSQVVQVVDTLTGLSAAFEVSDLRLSRQGMPTVAGQIAQTSCDSLGHNVLRFTPSLSGLVSNAGVNLTFNGSLNAKEVKGKTSIALALVDSASNTPFMSLIERNVADSVRQSSDSSFSIGIPFGILERNPKLAVLVNDKSDSTAQATLVNVYFLNDTSNSYGGGLRPASVPLPTDYNLGQNYPNPFNPTTTIEYALPAGQVPISV